MKKVLFLLFALTLGSLQAQMLPFDGVAAYVDDKVITVNTVLHETFTNSSFRNASFKQQLESHQTLFPVVLDMLIDNMLILKEYEAAGMNLPEETVNENVQRIIADNYDGKEANLHNELRRVGVTYPEWLKRIREKTIIEAMTYLQVEKKINVSPKRIREYYAANPERFTIADGMEISTLLIAPNQGRATAEKVLKDLREGADFATLAKAHSCDEYAAEGGARGIIKPEEHFNNEVVYAIQQLKSGEVSDIVEINGYCLIVKKGQIIGGTLRPLAEVWPLAERAVRQQMARDRYAEWIQSLRNRANIRIVSLDDQQDATK